MSTPLPVKKILLGALSIAWIRRREYLSALALPTLLFVLTWALAAAFTSNVSAYAALVILPFYAVAFTLFAVTCHRFILANDSELTARKRITLGRRELHFFGWMVTTYLIVAVVKVAMTTLLMTAHGVSEGAANGPPYWLQQLASIPAYYVLGRLCLVFPATAIDIPATLKWSWHKTQGNAGQMFMIVGFFPWLLSAALWLIWREEATIVERTLLTLLSFIGLSIEIFALSFSYRELEKQAT